MRLNEIKTIKYPRTMHLPWSPGKTSDDKVLKDINHFIGMDVVITEKMDGENTTMYNFTTHARSMDSKHHPSRDHLKSFWGSIKHKIPDGWRICGENVYAKHSIEYNDLEHYFLGFAVFNENNICLSWNDTKLFFATIGITPVPVLYIGPYNEDIFNNLIYREGYVIRNQKEFHLQDFNNNVAKFVRENHVQTDQHWMHKEVVPNKLKGK